MPHTALIDVAGACGAVGERTKAIVPVHLYGAPVDTAELAATGVAVVEDAAQAHGAVRHSTSAATAFSFYPTKNLGGIGDGGAVWTADSELADAVRRRRVHGMTEGYVHVDVSQNFRMSELEAAWLRIQLPHLAAGNRRRAEIARHYRSVAPQLRWQADHADHVYHLCVARVSDRGRARIAARRRRVSPRRSSTRVAITPTARLPRTREHTVPTRRAVGRRVHERAVLSRS